MKIIINLNIYLSIIQHLEIIIIIYTFLENLNTKKTVAFCFHKYFNRENKHRITAVYDIFKVLLNRLRMVLFHPS